MLELIGFLLPFLIGIIVRRITDKDVRLLIAITVCVIVGFFVAYIETQAFLGFILWKDIYMEISRSILAVFGASQFTYYFYENKPIPGVEKTAKELVQGTPPQAE